MNLKQLILSKYPTVKAFADALNLPRQDVSMMSRYFSGDCNPPLPVALRIASLLGVSVGELWSEYEYGVEAERVTDELARPLPHELTLVVGCIPFFEPITRKELMKRTGMTDRKVRRYIELAQRMGKPIINDGVGYRYARDDDEVRRYTDREYRRAMSILAKRSAMLRHTDKPQLPGQIKIAAAPTATKCEGNNLQPEYTGR